MMNSFCITHDVIMTPYDVTDISYHQICIPLTLTSNLRCHMHIFELVDFFTIMTSSVCDDVTNPKKSPKNLKNIFISYNSEKITVKQLIPVLEQNWRFLIFDDVIGTER